MTVSRSLHRMVIADGLCLPNQIDGWMDRVAATSTPATVMQYAPPNGGMAG